MERISLNDQPTVQAAPQAAPQSTTDFAQHMKQTSPSSSVTKILVPLVIVVILAGLGTGYVGASLTTSKSAAPVVSEGTDVTEAPVEENAALKVGQVVGAKDASAFKDSAEGVLVAGGVEGEGSHHIARPGGKSQNVYLTSSVMDLKAFEGHKVKVYGETFKGQKAGWLMDVGRAEVLELNSQLPDGAQPAVDLMEGSE